MGRDGKFHHLFRFSPARKKKSPPPEYICPISKSMMFDPYVVSSGQSFEGLSVRVCRDLGFTPTLSEGSTPDFSSMVPNTALKNLIQEWCSGNGLELPKQPTFAEIDCIVRSLMETRENSNLRASERELIQGMSETPAILLSHADTECLTGNFYRSSSSEESVVANNSSSMLPFATRPSCISYSSSPSSCSGSVPTEIASNVFSESSSEEEYFVSRMQSLDVYEQEQAVILLRKTTKASVEARVALCSERLLLAMRQLLGFRYTGVQINALASVVNLSLEKVNKVKILRHGIVPLLIDVLKNGSDEAREHAAGAIFSLAMEDENRTAIGVLGAIEPLIHELRLGTPGSRHDSALALYHLTFVRSNRTRIVQLGATGVLLGLLNDRDVASRVAFVLCNMAASDKGKAALFNNKGVECLVDVLRGGQEKHSESTLENCAAALQLLSDGSSKFKSVAMSCGALEVLAVIAEAGSKRAKDKAKRILEVLRRVETGEDGTEVDWDAVMKTGVSRMVHRPTQFHTAHSTGF